MLNQWIDKVVQQTPQLNETATDLSRAIHRLVLRSGDAGRSVVDILHGVGLGHPLHAILTDFAIGGWTMGALFDALWLAKRKRYMRQAADTLLVLGTCSALPTALSGLADFSAIPKRAAGLGLLHALTNIVNTLLFSLSLLLRHRRNRESAAAVSLTALGTLMLAAFLGGHLAYREQVGVNHDSPVDALPDWTPVAHYNSLEDRKARKVVVQEHPILLYRKDDSVYAISSICSHDGGQLEQGKFDRCTVQCPLHQSVFDLGDGHVVHGPATQAVTAYHVRIRDNQVEVRLNNAND